MHSDQDFGVWTNFMENCKGKWTNFWRSLLHSVADEEMRIRREEHDKKAEYTAGPLDRSGGQPR